MEFSDFSNGLSDNFREKCYSVFLLLLKSSGKEMQEMTGSKLALM
ncbi:hypothetical protein B879_00064 [Cecembia lonarensis LW9]|uniref:Uncharacterized protein n=1 Tax=Cecembia lonarensis (strain CCUG 58316 / KCTC 22772 / LW9) TaxID=1225176 RepID=K1L4G0_CECL9|nr:hypothetical protein B879_00064 [Cecembia lonarensis LW9]